MDGDESQNRDCQTVAPKEPDYEVGYGRPPVATRFTKGQSGNPRGRPKVTKAFGATLHEALNKKVQVREGDHVRARPKIEVVMDVAVNQAVKGDSRTLLRLLDLCRKEAGGLKPPQPEITRIIRTIVDPKDQDPSDQC